MSPPVKPRDPLSSGDAMIQACGLVGMDAVAQALGVGVDRVRQFTNPKGPEKEIPVGRAIEVDLLCLKHQSHAPLFQYYSRRLEHAKRAPQERRNITEALLEAQAALGALAGAVSQAIDPDSPGGNRITVAESPAILAAARRVRESMKAIEFAVADDCETSATVTPLKGAAS